MFDPNFSFEPAAAPGAESKNSFALSRLRRAFITCELPPGAFVSESEIAERFHLGRAAVRTALTRLDAERFVRVAPRSGWQVTPITGASIGDIISAQRMFARGIGALKFSAEMAHELLQAVTQADALLGRSEAEVLVVARNMRRNFIGRLAAAQGGLVAGWMAQCLDLEQRLIGWFERSNPRWLAQPLTPVAQVIVASDCEGAAKLLEEHFVHLRDWLIECLIRADDMVVAPMSVRGLSLEEATAVGEVGEKAAPNTAVGNKQRSQGGRNTNQEKGNEQ